MKSPLFLISVILVGALGTGLGLFAHHLSYGQHDAYLGAFDLQGTVTPANISSQVNLEIDGKGPRIEVSEKGVHDFGKMAANASGEHLFTVTNVGDAPLTLELGESTCKCTMGNLTKDSLDPGESTEVKLSWNVNTTGEKFGQQATLITNDPTRINFPLRVMGGVTRDFELSPKAMSFGTVTNQDAVDMQTRLYIYAEDNLKPTGKSEMSRRELEDLAKVDVTPLPREEFDTGFEDAVAGYNIIVHLEPGLPQGTLNENLLLDFTRDLKKSERSEFIMVPIQGSIEGRLRMVTNSKLRKKKGGGYLYLIGKLKNDEPYLGKALVILRGEDRDDINLRIESVFPEGIVSATLDEPKKGRKSTMIPIDVKLTPNGETLDYFGLAGDDNSYGKIVIASDNEDGAKMVLYLKFKFEG
ncbi:MAG: DUF1573 domain-containing protein [Planctomycetota bacterium]